MRFRRGIEFYRDITGAFTEPFIYGTIEVSHFRSRRVVIVRDVCFFIKIGLHTKVSGLPSIRLRRIGIGLHTKVSDLPSIRLHRIGIGLQRRGFLSLWFFLTSEGFILLIVFEVFVFMSRQPCLRSTAFQSFHQFCLKSLLGLILLWLAFLLFYTHQPYL